MATEEQRLSAMITDAAMRFSLDISALRITSQNTCLEILAQPLSAG